MEELTGRQRRYLRGLANQLKATVYLGKEGISQAVKGAVEEAYTHRELIKIRLEKGCPIERHEAGELLAKATGSHLVQVLGHTLLLYRRHPEEPVLQLPD
ncbi:MAG: ribosome assembly RNA-binding protein YhbY [Candidatus Handelsmanbacteria bacterium]|nr:ribosome assembly RNA-binding protein YhbY [Candidatus Handelsmanbacteria bacterium]